MMSKLSSRKLWTAIGTAVTALGCAAMGLVEWSEALTALSIAVGMYIGGQSAVDAAEKFKS